MNDTQPKEFRSFAKSWGSEFVRDGEVRFRLWAPGLDRLTLRLNGEDLPMARGEDGWFERVAIGVEAAAEYSFVLPDGEVVPDPASRAQAGDVHGPSLVVDPTSYRWRHPGWAGRPWEEAVIYELHVGTFTDEGTFRSAAEKLDHLASIGVTAVEIMPVAQFAGNRGWGYDGVLLYAPHPAYGSPDDFKWFVDEAHARGLMVLLDVVYNHFGPDGNYLALYAPEFFHPERLTPWGVAISYELDPVQSFFAENALYWLEEYNLDGLRLDAVDHADDALLQQIAARIRAEAWDKPIHLTTEDNRNVTLFHERGEDGSVIAYTAEWNDDFHNVTHAIATGEREAYYVDFVDDSWGKLARCLAEGYAYQGEVSPQHGEPRGEPRAHLPPTAFVDFLQNHDQVGNRAYGERLGELTEPNMLRVLYAVLLLSPHIPLLFMGEEFAEDRPFLFFTDFHGDLAKAVTEGRRREFAKFSAFHAPDELKTIPDPNDPETFEASRLDWRKTEVGSGRIWMEYIRELLGLRREFLVPALKNAGPNSGRVVSATDGLIAIDWNLGGATLMMRANMSDRLRPAPSIDGDIIFSEPRGQIAQPGAPIKMPATSIVTEWRKGAPGTPVVS